MGAYFEQMIVDYLVTSKESVNLYIAVHGDEFPEGPRNTACKKLQADWNWLDSQKTKDPNLFA